MSTDLVVIGAGGFGRETLDVVEALALSSHTPRYRLAGVVDDAPSSVAVERLHARGVPWLGSIDRWLEDDFGGVFVVGIGSPSARRWIDERLQAAGRLVADALVHPRACVGTQVQIGPGSIVCAGAQISTNVRVGRQAHLNPNATIGHDAVLGDHVSVNPGAIVSGEVAVGDRALIGAGAVVLQGLSVGAGALVGAAACVTKDVGAGFTVVGIPARRHQEV